MVIVLHLYIVNVLIYVCTCSSSYYDETDQDLKVMSGALGVISALTLKNPKSFSESSILQPPFIRRIYCFSA